MPACRRARLGVCAAVAAVALLAGCGLWSARGSAPAPAAAPSAVAARDAPPEGTPAPEVVHAATRIDRVRVETQSDGSRVVIELDGYAEPEVSLLVNQRLVIDIPGTACQALPREIEVTGDPLIERIRTGQHADPATKSRVVIDLKSRADFAVRPQSGRIVVLLAPAGGPGLPAEGTSHDVLLRGEPARTAPAPSGAATPPASPEPVVAATEPAAEPAASPAPAPSPLPSPETSAAEPGATRTPPPLVTPVASPAPLVEPTFPGESALRVIAVATATPPPPAAAEIAPAATPTAAAPRAVQTETAATPGAERSASPQPTPATRGKRISIDFTDADVRTVLELIARAGGYQAIFTPDVEGTITITLVDRAWEDALDTVLRAKRLREVREADIMLISPVGREHAKSHRRGS